MKGGLEGKVGEWSGEDTGMERRRDSERFGDWWIGSGQASCDGDGDSHEANGQECRGDKTDTTADIRC